jgi:protein gp37
MGKSNIPYLDSVWNPILGCDPNQKCAPRCWAAKLVGRMIANPRLSMQFHNAAKTAIRHENLKAVGWSGQSALVESLLEAPLHWRKPQRIGVNFLGDTFAANVPDAWIDRVFAVMALCPQHTFYVLTKQAEKMRDQLTRLSKSIEPLETVARSMGYTFKFKDMTYGRVCSTLPFPFRNVRLGVSVCNQAEADERIPLLLNTPAAFRWVSIEPMVGEVDLAGAAKIANNNYLNTLYNQHCLDWVVVGCESGPARRPCPWSWVEQIVRQCEAANVPCWVKQLDKGSRGVITPGNVLWPAWAKQAQP